MALSTPPPAPGKKKPGGIGIVIAVGKKAPPPYKDPRSKPADPDADAGAEGVEDVGAAGPSAGPPKKPTTAATAPAPATAPATAPEMEPDQDDMGGMAGMGGMGGAGAPGGAPEISYADVDYSDNDLCGSCANNAGGNCTRYQFQVDDTGHCEGGYSPRGNEQIGQQPAGMPPTQPSTPGGPPGAAAA